MNLKDSLNYISEKAKKTSYPFDVIASKSHSAGLSVFQGQVQNTEISDSIGLGIRIFKDEKPGYAYTERLTEDALDQTLKDAISHCEWTDKVSIDLPCTEIPYDKEIDFNSELKKMDLNQMKDLCIHLEKLTFEKSKEIENIPYLGAEYSESEISFINHKGLFYSSKSNSVSIGIGAVANRGDEKKLGSYTKSERDIKLFDLNEMASLVSDYATELLGAKKIQGGKFPVVLSERISGQMLRLYSQPYIAEAMQKGLSKLAQKEGEQIASKCFSLFSVGNHPEFKHHIFYDSEGMPTQLTKVVENGVFKDGLYNLETASKANRTSTGNGARNLGSKISTSFGNMYVPCGDQSTDELLKLFPKCLLIVRLDGNTGCNAISGELSIGAHGFWCENGQIVHPVDGLTLSGNYFDLIKDIVAVGNSYYNDFSTTKVPALAIEQLSVSN